MLRPLVMLALAALAAVGLRLRFADQDADHPSPSAVEDANRALAERLEAQIRRLGERETELERQIASLGERETELEAQVNGLSSQADELKGQVSGLRDQESQLESQVRDIADRERAMREEIAHLRESETSLEGRVADLSEQRKRLSADLAALRDSESALEAREQNLEARVAQLSKEADEAHEQWQSADTELRRTEEALRKAHTLIAVHEQRIAELEARPQRTPQHWSKALPPATFHDLIERARDTFPTLAVPDSAGQNLSKLDSSAQRDQWLSDTWKGLGALHEYASTDHDFRGDFWRWCTESGSEYSWYPDRLAMKQSPATLAIHGDQHTFKIDPRVNPSGQVLMEAHLKIVKTGAGNIPGSSS